MWQPFWAGAGFHAASNAKMQFVLSWYGRSRIQWSFPRLIMPFWNGGEHVRDPSGLPVEVRRPEYALCAELSDSESLASSLSELRSLSASSSHFLTSGPAAISSSAFPVC